MAQRKVITRKHSIKQFDNAHFVFSRNMIPVTNGNGKSPDFIKDYRGKAWNTFENLPMPSTSDEPWRRTDLRRLEASTFRLPEIDEWKNYEAVPREILKPLVGDTHGGQIILQPGGVQVEVDSELTDQGVIFTDLMTAEGKHADILARAMGQIVRGDEGKFASMASALASAGVLVYVPRGVEVEKPLHSVMWGPGLGLAHLNHIIVWVEDGASVTYVHETASPANADSQTLHNGIVEIHVGAGANLQFVELQSLGKHVWNFSHERAQVARDGNLDWVFVAAGSHLTKSFYDMDLIGTGASGRMSGFYFTDGHQHFY